MINAVHFYRAAHLLHRWRLPLLPRLIDYAGRFVFSCWLPHTAKLGNGVIVGYGGLGIVIGSRVVVGARTHINQGVTIGGSGTREGMPVLGEDVYVGAGAKILGPVHIGANSVIGANAVVTRDIPAGSVAVGIPARIVRNGVVAESFLHHRRERS